jgi:hypothetical protein
MATADHRTERPDQPPTIREIAALAARLRRLTAAGPDVDPAERAAFLADKAALLARIHGDTTAPATTGAPKALTIWQPWAECIAAGAKTVENRGRPFRYRGPLAIHAGLRRDRHAERWLLVRAVVGDPAALPTGALIAVAELVDCHPDAGCCRPWGEPGAYHLVLAGVRRLPRPIPARGQRGLWDVTGLVEDAGPLTLPAEINSGHTSGISDPRHQTTAKEAVTAGPAPGSIHVEEGEVTE